MKESIIPNPWDALKQFTDARIALGRAGSGLPTDEYLQFKLSHAQAKDAVWQAFDKEKIVQQLHNIGLEALTVDSLAGSKAEYLTRPDWGRQLSAHSIEKLKNKPFPSAVLFVVADGLSSKAVHAHAVPFIEHFLPYLNKSGQSFSCVVAEHARVALGDEIGQLLQAKIVILLIGERPGLSSPDSLGIYLTYQPRPGRLDSERNCISNVRPQGLNYEQAAFKLAWLVEQALAISCTGIGLKDQSDSYLLAK